MKDRAFLLFYNLFIRLYYLAIQLGSYVNPKMALWIGGRKNLFERLDKNIDSSRSSIWVHCSSLGEFEQGRPVIEALKNQYQDHQLIVSFYSPSGFEVRKDYSVADLITYMPLDTSKKAKRFTDAINPRVAIFIKYDLWYHHVKNLLDRDIPVVLISSLFTKRHWFFKWYGLPFLRLLKRFRAVFTQNEVSAKLLESYDVTSITAYDTRFDRVAEVASQSAEMSAISVFKGDDFTIVAGSTWPEDEKHLQKVIQNIEQVKLILAPHEVTSSHVRQIMKLFGSQAVLLSTFDEYKPGASRVLVIDNVGLLSKIYRYGDIAYIGGGFGKGIHNILEAAVYGKMVLFGPTYKDFLEAVELVRAKGAFSISSSSQLIGAIKDAAGHPEMVEASGNISRQYVLDHTGGTDRIIEQLKMIITG